MSQNQTPDVQKAIKPDEFDFLVALDLHHTVGRSLAAAIGEYTFIVTHNHLLPEPPVQPSQCFLDEVLTLAKLPDLYLKQEKYAQTYGYQRWRFELKESARLRDEYTEVASDKAFLESLKYTWDTLLSLMKGDTSKEVLIDVFSLMNYMLRIGGTSLMDENKPVLNTIVERVLGCWTSILSAIRNRSIAMLYNLLKMNFMLKSNTDRVASLFIFHLSQNTDQIEIETDAGKLESTQRIVKELSTCIGGISKLSEMDPEMNPDSKEALQVCQAFQETVASLVLRMQQICSTCLSVVSLNDQDIELKADLLSSLVDSYLDTPHIRVSKLKYLGQYLDTVKYPDETAMVQAERAAVIIDILTALWRSDPEATTHFTYPQYLPIRSTFARVDNDGNLALLKLKKPGEEESIYDFNPQAQRRYGASWVCWDLMLKQVLPYLTPYSDEDLRRFTGDTDIHDSIMNSPDFTIRACEEALDLASQKFIAAQHFEFAVITDTLLLSLYQAENDRAKQIAVHRRLADMSLQKLVDITNIKARVQTYWYRVGLWGDDFKASGEEGEYIIKEYNFTKLGDLRFKLIDKYKKRFGKEPVIVTANTMPELTEEQSKTPHIHMSAVDPLFQGVDESNRREDFFKKVGINTFYFESTIIIGPVAKKKEPGLQQLKLKRTTFETQYPLPYRTRRVRVSKAEIHEFSPAQKSALDITQKLSELDLMMNPLNEGQVRMLLKGMIAPEVNQGPIAIYRCFLKDFKDETSEEDQELIRQTFRQFFEQIRQCFRHLRDSTIPIDFRLPLITAYNNLLVEVEPELGHLPRMLQNIDY